MMLSNLVTCLSVTCIYHAWVYGWPHRHCRGYFTGLCSWRLKYPDRTVIIGGDFNTDLEKRSDVSSYINNFLANHSLLMCHTKSSYPRQHTESLGRCSRSHASGGSYCLTVTNFVEIAVKPWPRYDDFSIFQYGGLHRLGFSKYLTFRFRKRQKAQNASRCQTSWRSVKPLLRYGNFSIFPRWWSSAILDLWCVLRTTHERHLVVFITAQNLVRFDSVALIICMFFDFASLAWKRLVTPPKLGFLGSWPLNGQQYQQNPQKAHLFGRKRSYDV